MMGGGAAFIVCSLLSIFAVYKQAQYAMSDEFTDEVRDVAVATGEKLGNTISGTVEGLNNTIDGETEKDIAKLTKTASRILGSGIVAASSGFDETLGKTTVFLDESVKIMGVKLGRAEQLSDSSKPSFGLYLEFSKDFNATLRLTAYDSEDKKMDNCVIDVNETAGAEKIKVFSFDYFEPGKSGHCVLSVVE